MTPAPRSRQVCSGPFLELPQYTVITLILGLLAYCTGTTVQFLCTGVSYY